MAVLRDRLGDDKDDKGISPIMDGLPCGQLMPGKSRHSAPTCRDFLLMIQWKYIVTTQESRPMIKTLTKHGNSYALVIDKPVLELLRVTPETPFEIITDGQCLVLTPVRDAKEDKEFQDALAMVHKRFGRAMKRLAE